MEPEDAVKHLWEGARTLSSEKHVTRLLKSHYINMCRTVLKGRLPNVLTHMCPYCSSYWSENEFKLKLCSKSKLAQNSKSRNLIAKLEKAEKTKEKLLTNKQKRRAKWLRKYANTKFEIHCTFCGHKTIQPLEKAKKENSKVCQTIIKDIHTEVQPVKTNKKRKRKDKTAGLKIEGILSSKKMLEDVVKSPHTTKAVQIKQPPKVGKPKPQPSVNKPKANLHQTLKAKIPHKNKKTTAVSKTQHANKLLQLAEMLKKQNKNVKASENRLQALMK